MTILKFTVEIAGVGNIVKRPGDLAVMSYNKAGHDYQELKDEVIYEHIVDGDGIDPKTVDSGYDFLVYAVMANPLNKSWFVLMGVSLIALRGYILKHSIEMAILAGCAFCVKWWGGSICHCALNWKCHRNSFITVSIIEILSHSKAPQLRALPTLFSLTLYISLLTSTQSTCYALILVVCKESGLGYC